MTATATEAPVVQVGDFFYASWGYDQTNVDFFKVVGTTPKGVRVQHWTSRTVRDEGSLVYVVPGDGPTTGGWVSDPDAEYGRRYDPDVEHSVMFKRLQSGYEGRPSLSWQSYANLSYWDGTPKYQTGFGYGH